jgi:hypothetical protein
MADEADRVDDNGWDEYKKLVISEMKRVADYIEESRDRSDANYKELFSLIDRNYKGITSFKIQILDKVGKLNAEVSALKVKASLWGTLGGGIAAVLVAIGMWILQRAMVIVP